MTTSRLPFVSRDYSFLWPIRAGQVGSASLTLALQIDSPDAMNRTRDPARAVAGELSLARHVIRIAKGDRRIAAIPFFPHRAFPARSFYVRADGPMVSLDQLASCRIFSQSWSTTGDVWRRFFIRHAGLEPERLDWFTCEKPAAPGSLPGWDGRHVPAVHIPAGDAGTLLTSAAVDVAISSQDHRDLLRSGKIRRLFPSIRDADAAYFGKLGFFPPHHCYGVPSHRLAQDQRVLVELDALLSDSRRQWKARAENVVSLDATPWQEFDVEFARNALGDDWERDGIEANRPAIDALVGELHAEGLIDRRVEAEEIFSEFLAAQADHD